ncbi:MAG: NUDIX hydrolase [Planctomycetes bacterium]|nr:NUDIX hydrolase [Planctomycetota bacterium]
MKSKKFPLPEELSRKKVWSNGLFGLDECELLTPTGEKYHRSIITHPGAVTILAFLAPDEILMLRQYRHAARQYIWEIPAGLIEKCEKPRATAKRELIEETGYKAGRIKLFSKWFSAPGFAEEELFLYLAWDLEKVGQNLDPTEKFELHMMPMKLEKAYKLADKGEIIDSKTLIALYKYRALADNETITL